MSTTTTGRRPGQARPSPAVYRRRRIVALLILIVLVAAVVWGVTALLGRGDDPDATLGAAEAAPAESTGSEDAATEEPSGEVASCDTATLEAALDLDEAEHSLDSTVRFQVRLTNPGDAPCVVDAGPATLVAAVGSSSDSVWRSDHCAPDATNELLLDAGAETSVALAWDGRHSAAGCPGDQPEAGEGTYRVSVTFDGEPVESGPEHVFTIAAPETSAPEDAE